MKVKYVVRDVAKNLKKENKEILDILSEYSSEEKKGASVLNENEMNIIFERITQKNQIKGFAKFFAGQYDQKNQPQRKTAKKDKNSKESEKDKKIKDKKDSKDNKDNKKKENNKDKTKDNKDKDKNKDKAKSNTKDKTKTKTKSEGKLQDKEKKDNKPEKKTEKEKKPVKARKGEEQKKENNKNNSQDKKTIQDKKTENKRGKLFGKRKKEEKPKNNNEKSESVQKVEKNKNRKDKQKQKKSKLSQLKTILRPNHQDKQEKKVTQEAQRKDNRGSRVVDTRVSNINIDKYNEKYDRLASEKMKTDNVVNKQKLNQRSRKKGKPRNAKRETEAERLRRIAMERKTKPITVQIPEEITVGELATRLKATVAEVIKKLMMMGTMATVNDLIDFDTASLVAMEFHAKVEKEVIVTIEEQIIDDSEDDDENLSPRAPVVVVMGHVDHGKTSLLDVIRHTSVTSSEAGGITQHIGAYRVTINDRDITFLDTPGHEAFTTMRARGAQVTDIAILVVAADDGIMPQTIEAINHAKAAGVSIIVAINKIDKDGANIENVKNQLTEYELIPEEWGGDVPCIPVSAKTKQGIDELLEMVILIADMKEMKANPDRAGKGTVIEARLDKGRGPIATMLVQNGTMKKGDIIVAGTCVGRVRAMTDERGRTVTKAGPSVPVEITGLNDVPNGGDVFNCVSDERLARELVEQRKTAQKEEIFNAQTKITLDNLFDQMQIGEIKELKIIVKADVQGSVEAVRQSLEKLSNNEVRVKVIHGAVGAINESDVMLANASNAIVVGFNVRPDPVAMNNAEKDGVDLRTYRIIYDCIEEIQSAMKGMLAPKYKEKLLGRAECRQVYKVSHVGTISGSYVLDGKITRNSQIRVVREGAILFEDEISSLRRFKDDVKEVAQGYECGISLEKFNDIKEGDILEAFIMEEYR